jgi:hypothetical protein
MNVNGVIEDTTVKIIILKQSASAMEINLLRQWKSFVQASGKNWSSFMYILKA